MSRRIPEDAFALYYSLGPDRSYQSVAEEYGVSKQAVAKLAKKEGWLDRVRAIDADAQQKVDQHIAETVEDMHTRHLKMLKIVQAKGLEALKTMPLSSAMEAVRALDMTIKQERLIRGEPTDRAAVSVEDTIRREYERWGEDDVEDEDAAPETAEQAGLLQ